MHIAYLDDSGSDAKSPIVVVGGIVIPDYAFPVIEQNVGWVVDRLIPPELISDFKEFHAADLFWGNDVFARLDQNERHEALRQLVRIPQSYQLPFIYAAVDKRQLATSPFGSSLAVDVAFRLCVLGVEEWMASHKKGISYVPQSETDPNGPPPLPPLELCVFVVDDSDDKIKYALKTSFRALRMRQRGRYSLDRLEENRLRNVHDDMYFGESKDSIGIQVADVCNFFMMRRLRDNEDSEFFDLLAPAAIYASPEPEFSQCEQWLVRHDVD